MELITRDDLPPEVVEAVDPALLDTMLDGLNARAARLAPCLIEDPSGDKLAEAKLLLIGVISRWVETGTGAYTQQTAGPWSISVDTRATSAGSGYSLRPNEVTYLQDLCRGEDEGRSKKAFMVDQVQPTEVPDSLRNRPDLWFQWVQPVPPNAP